MRNRFLRDRLRKARAWRKLSAEGRDVEHYRIFQEIPFGVNLGLPKGAFNGLVDEAYRAEAETCLKQRLYLTARDSGLYAEMICSLAGDDTPVSLPAPKAWRDALAAKGFRIAGLNARWGFFKLQLKAMREGLGVLRRYLRQAKGGQPRATGPYVAFPGMRNFYMPQQSGPRDGVTRWDLLSWYRRSSLWSQDIAEIWITTHDDISDADLTGVRVAVQPLADLDQGQWPAFLRQALTMTAWAAVRWMTGGWWVPFVLPQALQLAYVRRLEDNQLPKQVGFNSTQKVVRPLWTYDAERRGTRVMLFLYSKNVSVFIPSNPDVPGTAPDFAQVSWPEYVVWDEDHKNELVATGVDPKATFTQVGPLGFADSADDLPDWTAPAVAVFDVDALRVVDCAEAGYARPYWTHDAGLAFVEGCFKAIRAAGATPVYKPKGYLRGHLMRPRAKAFYDLVAKYDAVLVDGLINANRVIEATDASISMPFTSTAASGAYLDRPSAFYDPTGTLHNHVHLADTVPVIFDPNDLHRWVCDHLKAARRTGT